MINRDSATFHDGYGYLINRVPPSLKCVFRLDLFRLLRVRGCAVNFLIWSGNVAVLRCGVGASALCSDLRAFVLCTVPVYISPGYKAAYGTGRVPPPSVCSRACVYARRAGPLACARCCAGRLALVRLDGNMCVRARASRDSTPRGLRVLRALRPLVCGPLRPPCRLASLATGRLPANSGWLRGAELRGALHRNGHDDRHEGGSGSANTPYQIVRRCVARRACALSAFRS